MAVRDDVGMAVKMNSKCFPGIRDLAAGKPIDEAQVLDLCDFVDARHDCADFRMIVLLKTFLDYRALLSAPTAARIESSILSFKYAMDEPGTDGMCFWSENHQLIFAACEYLAGGLFPERTFSNDGRTGAVHRAKARVLLLRWMGYRFTYGFNEFHSNTYYEEDVAPLSVLSDHADGEVAARAGIVLDLLFLDMALHSFEGRFVAASGRCYELPKRDPATADVNDLMDALLQDRVDPDWTRLSALFFLTRSYRIPAAVRAIANDRGPVRVTDSMGLSLREVRRELKNRAFDDLGLYFWAMEAFTNVESIATTMAMFSAWNLRENNFLRDLKTIDIPILRRLGLLPLLVRILNPATQGVAIERANTLTYRTARFMVSAAQEYRPGFFGDQQHLWQATLPGGVAVFSTHPGSPMFDDPARNFSPSYWVGNGINPHVASTGDVVLLAYDLRVRRGYLERKRQDFVHFHVPRTRFDESETTPRGFIGRLGDAYLAIRSDVPGAFADDHDLIFRGRRSHFAVVVGDVDGYGSFAAFRAAIGAATLVVRGGRTTFRRGPDGPVLDLSRRGGLRVDGVRQDHRYPRLSSPYGSAPRKPETMSVAAGGHRLTLDFIHGTRKEEPLDGPSSL